MPEAPRPALAAAGVVLCGGSSRRMGTDKALLVVEGRPLARRVHDALTAAGCTPVVAVGGDADALGDAGLVVVPDHHPGEGPLGALLTAFAELADADVIVALGCDLVDADPRAIAAVLAPFAGPDAAGLDVVVPRSDERRHMHHAAWHRRALPTMAAAYAGGERAPRRVLDQLRVCELPAGPGHPALELAWLTDLDTPADLARRAG